MTNPKDYELYRERLETSRNKLLQTLKDEESPEDLGSDVDDSQSTEADEAESMANRLSIAQSVRTRITEIDEALAAITSGTYGVCTKCGSAIEKEVLELVPESRLCSRCKKLL